MKRDTVLPCLPNDTLRDTGPPMGRGNLHRRPGGPGEVVGARRSTTALVDAALGVRAGHPAPVARLSPTLLDGQGNVIGDSGRTNPALAAVAGVLGKGHHIEGHQGLLHEAVLAP